MPFQGRVSGVLLHPTSFPGHLGIGNVGPAAYPFIDFLAESQQSIWQVLPLGPTGHGNSPYMSYSSMAGNPLLISLESLGDKWLLSQEDIAQLADLPEGQIDYEAVTRAKMPLLVKAADTFKEYASDEQQAEFHDYCEHHSFWLDDYALFMALKDAHHGKRWTDWDEDIAKRHPDALNQWRDSLAHQIYQHKFWQFEFFRQWTHLKQYANERGITIIGDMPIYVAHDSADVWSMPHIFRLDKETGEPELMAGVPPDYFSETGQLWGNPIYNWDAIKEWGFKWWLNRFKSLLDYVDYIRIDHFRGFQAYWEVDQGETTAMNGRWVDAPGDEFFEVVKQELGTLPIIAEDLGVITPDVEALRDKFGFPGMKILQFAFGSGPGNPYLPFNYSRNCLVYTGTHDNNTTVGWFKNIQEWEREGLIDYLGQCDPDTIHWDLIRLALSSVADVAIFPLQDVLGLGEEARMNTPGQPSGNWGWRYREEDLTQELSDRLKHLTTIYGRAKD
ncbi:MAG: 4-alpha-glucanotransferase [Leptolyngbyaceae bacterium]|nr:4-alpha-glucanotransferase [Leptolyngbyaceae bacterium]